jgi:ATP-dependent DNA ligase
MPPPKKAAMFVEPMECLAVSKLPEGPQWLWELKWDGYRAEAVKNSTVKLYSRNHKSLDTVGEGGRVHVSHRVVANA